MIGLLIVYAFVLFYIFLLLKGYSIEGDKKSDDEEQIKWIQEYRERNKNSD